jgi:hypothetical protein
MAHFAQLDENNVVVQVIVVKNSEILDENGNESEEKGIAFCQALLGVETRWVQTSYNGNFRARYAVIGHTYYPSYDAFIAPKPRKNPSFIIDPIKFDWVPPVPRPTDDVYKWNEDLVAWLRVPAPYPSWVMQGEPLTWVAPVPRPDDGGNYRWDESSLSWILVTQP